MLLYSFNTQDVHVVTTGAMDLTGTAEKRISLNSTSTSTKWFGVYFEKTSATGKSSVSCVHTDSLLRYVNIIKELVHVDNTRFTLSSFL